MTDFAFDSKVDMNLVLSLIYNRGVLLNTGLKRLEAASTLCETLPGKDV